MLYKTCSLCGSNLDHGEKCDCEREQRDYIFTPWIGVDLDGTLAHYDEWKGITHIGEPIPEMIQRVNIWLSQGRDVRIFTARVCPGNDVALATQCIEAWCLKHFGRVLAVTCVKDFSMVELWDDRCVQVIKNTGRPVQAQSSFIR